MHKMKEKLKNEQLLHYYNCVAIKTYNEWKAMLRFS